MIYRQTRKLKDHRLVEYELDPFDFYGVPLEQVLKVLKETAPHLIKPVLFIEAESIIIEGFVKMTLAQIKREKRKEDALLKKAKEKIDKDKQKDIEQLKKLYKKYPDALT